MAKLFSANQSQDFYINPAFPFRNRLRRLVWQAIQTVFFRCSPRPFFGWRAMLLRCFGAKIGKNTFIYPSAKIWAPWLLEVADIATIGPEVEVYNPGGVSLRHHAIVSQGAFLCGATHDFNQQSFPMISSPIIVEAYGWVCARVLILPGVVVGEGAVIGAGAVLAKKADPWTIYVGNPARKVGERARNS